jgi:hypothetical protein
MSSSALVNLLLMLLLRVASNACRAVGKGIITIIITIINIFIFIINISSSNTTNNTTIIICSSIPSAVQICSLQPHASLPGECTFNTLSLKPETRNHYSQTLNHIPQALDHNPQTLNHNPQTHRLISDQVAVSTS